MSFFGNRRQTDSSPSPVTPKPTVSQPPVGGQQPVGFETVLGANSVMEGVLKSAANVRLDGTFTGTLEITGNVLVGETARINADIHARNVSIAGAVRGNVSGKKVQLLRTGRIWGDIRAQALTTEEGAFIDGKITMISKDPPVEELGAPTEASENDVVAQDMTDSHDTTDDASETVAEIVAAVEADESSISDAEAHEAVEAVVSETVVVDAEPSPETTEGDSAPASGEQPS